MSSNITIPDIIKKKKDGHELSDEEIKEFIDAVAGQRVQGAQIGAWLMAVCLKGMTSRETTVLTRCMMNSGTTLNWEGRWEDPIVDKRSTGGVGDKVILVLVPVLASCKMKVEVGNGLGIKTAALITSMDCPLGQAVGHAVEVAESIHCLKGNGPADLTDLVVETGGMILLMAGKVKSPEKGREMIRRAIQNGTALAKFRDMAVAQGVSKTDATNLCVVKTIKAMDCAKAVQHLGGAKNEEDDIDRAVGLILKVTPGERVSEGEPWVDVHHSTPDIPDIVRKHLDEALIIVPKLTADLPVSRVLDVIMPDAE